MPGNWIINRFDQCEKLTNNEEKEKCKKCVRLEAYGTTLENCEINMPGPRGTTHCFQL